MSFIRVLLVFVLAVAAVALAAQPRRTLARVVSVEAGTVTVEALEGYLTVGDEVEVWTESGKRLAKVTLPVDLVNTNDRVAGVRLSGAVPPAGALLTQKGQFSSWSQASSALAAFPPKAVARVVSVEGPTVTLQVTLGTIVNGDELDVLTPRGKATAKVKAPKDIDLMLKGDTVKGVTLVGATVAAGDVLADKGRFPTLAAVSALANVPAASATESSPGMRESAEACAFTPEELTKALGFKVGPGRGQELPFGTGTMLSCTWSEEKGLRTVHLKRTVMTSGEPATNREQFRAHLAGRLELIAGDKDFAGWQVDQGDNTNVTLHYFRGNTFTEVRVSGVDMKNARAVASMRKAVLGLRRL
ncbi:MAG: hypothetical protein AB1730_20840 [Myxococcota bacterium]|jgi:hypothetical protein